MYLLKRVEYQINPKFDSPQATAHVYNAWEEEQEGEFVGLYTAKRVTPFAPRDLVTPYYLTSCQPLHGRARRPTRPTAPHPQRPTGPHSRPSLPLTSSHLWR